MTIRTWWSCTSAPPPSTTASPFRPSIAPSSSSRRKGIIERLDFRDGRSRYEQAAREHHDHLINLETGDVIEFQSDEIEALQVEIARRLGYKVIYHRLELYAVPNEEDDA